MSGHSPRILDPDDFRKAWKAEPLLTRDRISRAVNAGEAMEDAEDAALAAAYARKLKREKTGAMRMMTMVMLVVAVGVLTAPDEIPPWTKLIVLVLVFGSTVREYRGRHRHDEIASANEAVVRAYWAERRPEQPASGSIADAVEQWRQRAVGEGE